MGGRPSSGGGRHDGIAMISITFIVHNQTSKGGHWGRGAWCEWGWA